MALQKYFSFSFHFKYLRIFHKVEINFKKSLLYGNQTCLSGLSSFFIKDKIRNTTFYSAFIFVYCSNTSEV